MKVTKTKVVCNAKWDANLSYLIAQCQGSSADIYVASHPLTCAFGSAVHQMLTKAKAKRVEITVRILKNKRRGK